MANNSTLVWLWAHTGQHVVTTDRIYLYQEKIYLEPGQSVLILDATNALTSAPARAAEEAAPVMDSVAAELLYPDGVIRWTWVVIGDKKYQDSLGEVSSDVNRR